MKIKHGREDRGYLINSTLRGRGEVLFDTCEGGIIPYLDSYLIIPKEQYDLELLDAAFEEAYKAGNVSEWSPDDNL